MSIISEIKHTNLFLPKIELKKRLKKVKISGVSRMPDPSQFYHDLAYQLECYFEEFNGTLLVDFYFDYINTCSTKWLYYILRHLESLVKENGLVEVTWQYDHDDESIELAGDILKSQVTIPFTLIALEN